MLKLKLQNLDKAGTLINTTDCGHFRSYADIGKYLYYRGKPGKYYAMPSNMTSLAAIKEITVTRDKYDKQVMMDGSAY